MNHATICIFLNQLKHPFPNLFNSIQLNSTQISSSSPMYSDSGGLKTNKKSNRNKKQIRDAPSLCDKVHLSKKQKLDVCKPRVCWSSGVVFTSQCLGYSPSMDSSWCISSNPCGKTSKHCFSHFYSVG